MFTGLIERFGTVQSLHHAETGWRITIQTSTKWQPPLQNGESVAVQGVCLTVSDATDDTFHADILEETLRRSSLATISSGNVVNIERAMPATGRFGGHIVTGHVDGTGRVSSIGKDGADTVVTIDCEEQLMREIVLKGSVACNGVSLTVTATTGNSFTVNLIPTTLTETNLGRLERGDIINIETDIIGKYVIRAITGHNPQSPSLSLETLRNAGFIES